MTDADFAAGRILPPRSFACRECGGDIEVAGGWFPTSGAAMDALSRAGGSHALLDLPNHPSMRDIIARSGHPQPDGVPWPEETA